MKNKVKWLVIIALLTFGMVQTAYGGGVIDSVLGKGNGSAGGGSGPAQSDTNTSDDSNASGGIQPVPPEIEYDKTGQKTLTITGLKGIIGGNYRLTCYIKDNASGNIVAVGPLTPSLSTVTFKLMDEKTNGTTAWTGSGSYNIFIDCWPDGNSIYYTDGRSWSQVGVREWTVEHEIDYSRLPKFNFSAASSTIDFSKFRDMTELL